MGEAESNHITRVINSILDESSDTSVPQDPEVFLIYDELKKVARYQLRGQNSLNTLTPTVLVNEVFLKLYSNPSHQWKDRKHFYSTASKAIKHIIIDAARQKQTAKRGDLQQSDVELDQLQDKPINNKLNDALSDLETSDDFLYKVVELKFFIGLTSKEAGEILGCSRITVERAWKKAKSFILSYQ
ncbi:MAG: ECF-type sigma factor [Marinicella sp.]